MSYEVLSIPLVPGVRQDVDRTMLPPGSLVASTGTRMRKGSIAKSNGLVSANLSKQGGGNVSGTFDALGYAAGREVAIVAGHAYARRNLSDTWQPVGRASRARPVKAHWGAFTDVGSAIQPACAIIGENTAFAYFDGTGVQVGVFDEAGIRRASAFFTGRDKPRIFAVGSTYVLVMRSVGGTNVIAATIDGSTLAASAESVIATLTTVDDAFDAAPFNSTTWLLALRNGTTAFEVGFWDTSFASGAFQQVACNNAAVRACVVYGTDGEGIWCTFDDQAAQKIAAFTEDLSSTTGAAAGFATSLLTIPAVITRRSATTVWIVWSELSSSPTRYLMRVAAYDTTAALSGGAVGYAWHLHAASRPWGGSTSRFSMWVHTDDGTPPWAVQRRYTLATFSMDLDTPSAFGMFIEPELSPDERSNQQQSFHVPAVAFRTTTDESGAPVERGLFPALATIRTQNDTVLGGAALVLYEWETDTGMARSRQVAEIGGQGVVFGGGLQELPSARISRFAIDTEARGAENGFVFAPAILSASATASGAAGLTEGALYQFRAVFEYITPDGLRVRSAPSNIATATPTAGNLNVELKISTSPTSEREFSSLPNQTAIHIYATVGNGNTFQRITQDSGLSAGIGSITVGMVTYVHSAADSTYRANEPLYTERGGIANQPAPAHRFGWVGGGYAWVGGLFNPQLVERSKLVVPNEPVQFTRDNSHRCLLPEECTGGAWLDNVSVLFSRTGIYVVSATLGAPQRLPSTVGCVDFRSIVELPTGLGFQSRRGYELLPRGFGEPTLISGPVQDSLRGRRVISATVTGTDGGLSATRDGGRQLVLMAIDPLLDTDPGVRLVLDLDSGRWLSVDAAMAASVTSGEIVTTWDGRLVVASRLGAALRYESPTDWGATETVPMSLTLADLRPFDVLRRGQIARVLVLGEVRSTTEVTLEAYSNGVYSEKLKFRDPKQTVTGTAGDKFTISWDLPVRQTTALTLKFTLADPSGATPGEGLVVHAVGVDAAGLPGRPRVAQERQAA